MKREIIDIIRDAVKEVSESVDVVFTDYNGNKGCEEQPAINFIFGSAQYFKDALDELNVSGQPFKFPAIVLFTPVTENRNDTSYYSTARVNMLICTGTQKIWSNEQREEYSFTDVLRPIYRRLLEVLKQDKRLDFGYTAYIKHDYSENYSYGKYGAYVNNGEMVTEPIDAIDIRNMELKIKLPTCR